MICDAKNCKDEAELLLKYDCGVGPEQILHLCQKHYDSNPIFKEHVNKIVEIK